MGPRANYECKKCQATYQDLPIQSVRCPVCGMKRGFRRLFDAINVGTGVAPRVDGLIRPMLEHRDGLRAGREQHSARQQQLEQRMQEVKAAPPQIPRGAAPLMNMISPDSQNMSRTWNTPIIQGLRQHGRMRPMVVGNDPTPVPKL